MILQTRSIISDVRSWSGCYPGRRRGHGLWTPSIRARRVKPVDATGAEYTLAAGIIDRLLNGCTMNEALRFGVVWGTASTLVRQSVTATPLGW